jgi:hypothetical protein
MQNQRQFWATRAGTPEREAEARLALKNGLVLFECKSIEGFALGTLAGQQAASEAARQVWCDKCGQAPGNDCFDPGSVRIDTPHAERFVTARQIFKAKEK